MGDCFLHGWGMAGGWHEPGLQVVSMYVDQQADSNPHDDTSETGIHRQRAEEFGFELYDDIAETLRDVKMAPPRFGWQREGSLRLGLHITWGGA